MAGLDVNAMIRKIIPALSRVLLLPLLLISYQGMAQQPVQDAETRVTTAPLAELLVQPVRRVSAKVIALSHAQISSQANGEVLRLEVEVGDGVEKGDILVALDCRQSELSEAVLNDVLSLARKEYKRAQSLQKTKTIAEQEITRLQSALEQARIRIQQAELAVENCLIKAPFKGIVTERQVQLGMLASVGAPMMKLLKTEAVEVAASLDAQAIRDLQRSNNIQFNNDGQDYPVQLRTALPFLDSTSNKQDVRLSFSGRRPLPGSSGDLYWPASGQYLPADLLIERRGKLGYFVVDQDRAKFVALPGAIAGHPALLAPVQLESSAAPVVLEGRFKLKDGDRIILSEGQP